MIADNGEGTRKPDRSALPVEVAKFTEILDEKVHEVMEAIGPKVLGVTSMAVAMVLFTSDVLTVLEGFLVEGAEAKLLLAKANKQMRIVYVPFLMREAISALGEGAKCGTEEAVGCADCPYISVCKAHMDKYPEDRGLSTPENFEVIKARIARMF